MDTTARRIRKLRAAESAAWRASLDSGDALEIATLEEALIHEIHLAAIDVAEGDADEVSISQELDRLWKSLEETTLARAAEIAHDYRHGRTPWSNASRTFEGQ
jgi:hypothetical protein